MIERGEPLPPMLPAEPTMPGQEDGSEAPEAGERLDGAPQSVAGSRPDPLREPEEAVPVSSARVDGPAARTKGSAADDP